MKEPYTNTRGRFLAVVAAAIGLLLAVTGCVSSPATVPPTESPSVVDAMRKSLVRIHVTSQSPSYEEPWKPGNVSSGVGSGFVIDGERIMTNAHVVSNARIIMLERDGDPRKYPAKVLYAAHDCDLALIAPEDPAFFEGTVPLSFGDLPDLQSTVTVFGYPIGGSRMSVTRGVVSRIEFRTYSHSGLDAHLAVQIDAAINPGNSGGPVVQDGVVVGVAFQGLAGGVAQNIGYMIPTPVTKRFIQDVEDGTYDGYVELAVFYQDLVNEDYRAYLGLPDNDLGVVVHNVLDIGSAAGHLQAGDVMLSIEDRPIYSDGHIRLRGDDTQLEEVVERKFHGDTVTIAVLRDGEELDVSFPLKGAWPYKIFSRTYDERPEYVTFAGLVFQPLERNLVDEMKIQDVNILYWYNYFVQDGLYKSRPQPVLLSSILPDGINAHIRHMAMSIVDQVNGERITTMRDLAAALSKPVEVHEILLLNQGRPIVLYAENLADAQQRIMRNYGIARPAYLKPDHAERP